MLIRFNVGDLLVGKCRVRVEEQILKVIVNWMGTKTDNCQVFCPLT